MITREEIRAWQMTNQHLMEKADPMDVVQDLCGLQAQIASYALHGLHIRAEVPDGGWLGRHLMRNWTIRGTMHLFAKEDAPLFLSALSGQNLLSRDWSKPSFWNQRSYWRLTPKRQGYLADIILHALENGPLPREKLKDICRKAGMTEAEEGSMFDSWGGGIREMCERGFIHYTAESEKSLELTPSFDSIERKMAQRMLAERYFHHYGPATLHDLMYFFHLPAKMVKEWICELPLQTVVCEEKTYFYINKMSDTKNIPEFIYLAGFDPLLLGHEKNESLYLDAAHIRSVFTLSGMVAPTLLIDGKVAGKWKKEQKSMTVTPFVSLSTLQKTRAEEAARRMYPDLCRVNFTEK